MRGGEEEGRKEKKGKGKVSGADVEREIWPTQKFWRGAPMP